LEPKRILVFLDQSLGVEAGRALPILSDIRTFHVPNIAASIASSAWALGFPQQLVAG